MRLLFLFMFISSISYSQKFPSDIWHEGMLITNNGDTVKGNLKYDFELQSIQLDDGNLSLIHIS